MRRIVYPYPGRFDSGPGRQIYLVTQLVWRAGFHPAEAGAKPARGSRFAACQAAEGGDGWGGRHDVPLDALVADPTVLDMHAPQSGGSLGANKRGLPGRAQSGFEVRGIRKGDGSTPSPPAKANGRRSQGAGPTVVGDDGWYRNLQVQRGRLPEWQWVGLLTRSRCASAAKVRPLHRPPVMLVLCNGQNERRLLRGGIAQLLTHSGEPMGATAAAGTRINGLPLSDWCRVLRVRARGC